MKLPAFVPEELRQLARFVPTHGWDVIDWKPLLGAMRTLSWRLVSGKGTAALRGTLAGQLPALPMTDTLDGLQPLGDVTSGPALRRHGDAVLRLYFTQWLLDDGLFLDLRQSRFAVDKKQLVYSPSGLWIRLRPQFREGMLALYRSFYSGDDAALEAALLQMGMLQPQLSAAARTELIALLQAHFGIEQSAQQFSIDAFKRSFDDLFEFFIANDYTLHSDFVFVGFYLITLYLNLESGGQRHNVRELCAQALL